MQENKKGTSDFNTGKESKIALVTGGNSGVGFQIAKALAASGYTVYVGSRNLKNGQEAVDKIGENAIAIQIDVTNQNSILSAVNKVQEDFGYLTLLVNNAGISHAGTSSRSLEEIMLLQRPSVASIDEMRTVWDTNVFGVLAVTQAFLPLLRNAPAARILNISSAIGSLTLNSDLTFPYRTGFDVIYGASKTALNAITVSLAIELEGTNIKVNSVSPGFAATALNNFEGTETPEQASSEPIRVALEEDGPSGIFTAPHFGNIPW